MDHSTKCKDNFLQELAFLGVSEPHDNFFWRYLHGSHWFERSFQRTLDLTRDVRCQEKVKRDFAFLEFSLAKDYVGVSKLNRQYDYQDRVSLIGKKFRPLQSHWPGLLF